MVIEIESNWNCSNNKLSLINTNNRYLKSCIIYFYNVTIIILKQQSVKLSINKVKLACALHFLITFVNVLDQKQDVYTMSLYDAAVAGDLERVMLLVGQGVDKDEIFDETALYFAAQAGHLEVVRFLVDQGADMERACSGETPLYIASCTGRLEVVRYLLEQGANRDKACDSGWTSLHWAAQRGHLEIAKLLMVYGADLNARNSNGLLAIDVAWDEEIKQAIREEPRRRLDHGHKRVTEHDRHPDAATSASAQQDEEEEQEQDIKQAAGEGEVADEDQDSEPSSDEEDGGNWMCTMKMRAIVDATIGWITWFIVCSSNKVVSYV